MGSHRKSDFSIFILVTQKHSSHGVKAVLRLFPEAVTAPVLIVVRLLSMHVVCAAYKGVFEIEEYLFKGTRCSFGEEIQKFRILVFIILISL